MNTPSGDHEAEPTIDPEAAVEHVRNAWLNLQVFSHVDSGSGGGYAFDPSDYAPVPIHQDGEATVVFARV